MGSKLDMRWRKAIRLDTPIRRIELETARKIIFQNGVPIDSKRVDKVLGNHSLTPTRVCHLIEHLWLFAHFVHRIYFRTDSINLDQISSGCLSLISCMNLNSAFGKPHLLT